jgi:hypothetical protein
MRGYTTVEVEVDIDDVLDGMHRTEKQRLVDFLCDEGYVQTKFTYVEKRIQSQNATTPSEIELLDIINAVWDNRDFLTAGNIDVLRSLSKKGMY